MWNFLDDIETLELTYRGSQLSPMTRPHTKKHIQTAVITGYEGARWARGCSDGLHSWENLNLAGHFFRFGWSTSVMWDRPECGEAPTVSEQQWADIKGIRRLVESDPWPSLAHSVTFSTPWPLRSQPHCHISSSCCLRGPVFRNSHSQHPGFPVKVTLWHLLDWTQREGKGHFAVCVWIPYPMTPRPLEHQSGPVLQQLQRISYVFL